MSDAKTVLPPVDKRAYLRQAVAALAADRFDIAGTLSERILAGLPEDVEASYLLGLSLGARGRPAAAAALLHRVHVARPEVSHPVLDATATLRRIGREADIVPQLRACLAIAPENLIVARALADELCEIGAPDAAASALAPALRFHPDDAAGQVLMGIIRHDLGALDQAMAHFRAAAVLLPGAAAPWANIGLLEQIAGRFTESIAAYDEALRRDPGDPRIRLSRAVTLLRAGRMREAWTDYECRFEIGGRAPAFSSTRLLPDLRPDDTLEDRTVLLTHEDGFGDTLQFVRYAKRLAERGARVVLRVPDPLQRLLRTVPGVADVISAAAATLEFDFFCPMFSVPRAFGTTLDDIPVDIPYLQADPADVATWASRLPPHEGLRVGLVWAGQARPWAEGFRALDRRRSLNLATLAPFGAVPDLQFVSLQAGPPAAEAAAPPPGLTPYDPMAGVRDFADTAAIIANLDLVVSVDTSVVHLAGALGKPTYLLDRYDSCWRWLSGRDDSPWYPTLRIFRQTRMGDWGPVIANVTAALAAFQGSDQVRIDGRGTRSVSTS